MRLENLETLFVLGWRERTAQFVAIGRLARFEQTQEDLGCASRFLSPTDAGTGH